MKQAAPALSVNMDFEIDLDASQRAALQPARLIEACQAAAMQAGLSQPAEMSLVIADDVRVQELNRVYRGVDATTDVLAFGEKGEGAPAGAGAPHFVVAPAGEPSYLGDVIISLPQAARQAAERGHTLQSELCLLAVHGTLHLLGFEHGEPADKARMWDMQRAALRRLGCEDAQPED
jgi:probable rRNA maturation factor